MGLHPHNIAMLRRKQDSQNMSNEETINLGQEFSHVQSSPSKKSFQFNAQVHFNYKYWKNSIIVKI